MDDTGCLDYHSYMRFEPRSPLGEPERVLVVLPTWVGDFVMATPTLRAIRNRFATSKITFLAEENLEDLIRGGDWMDDVCAWPPKALRNPLRRTYQRLVRDLRRRRFGLAVLLPNSFRSALIARLSGAKRRIGYDRDRRGLLLTDRVAARNRVDGDFAPYPIVEYYADLAEAVGCERPGDALELFTTEEDDIAVIDRLDALGVTERGTKCRPIVVISPGARFGAAKCWLPERFAGTADRLIVERGVSVIITCGPGEESIARAIGAEMHAPGFVLDNPRLTLGQLKSLIRRCDLLLCNDAGPRHFAKAFGVPVVTIFGPTHPEWTATSYPAERIVRIDVDCGPCQKRTCPLGHLDCMTGVDVETVYFACCDLMNVGAPSHGDQASLASS